VIFIITTLPPVTEKELKLPTAAKRLKEQPPKATYISIQTDGSMYLNKDQYASANDMLQKLISMRTDDPDLSIIVRGDGHTKYKDIRSVLDVCQQAQVLKVELATDPLDTPK
jgi:biopolymer transport protein TolR